MGYSVNRFSAQMLLALGILVFQTGESEASSYSSHRTPHPIGWQHLLPVGEHPGWDSKFWIQTEVSHANIWNAPMTLVNNSTGDLVDYSADFEQNTTILEIGGALTSWLAFSLEVPYASRIGGYMDGFIDDFHVFIGSDRFGRPFFEEDENRFSVSTNGQEFITGNDDHGVSNLKAKLKLWWWQVKGAKGNCPCGFSTSLQAKFPTGDVHDGMTSGDEDYSLVWHLGVPILKSSAVWFTSAVTKLGDNPALAALPRREWVQMYELAMDLDLLANWGFILQMRVDTPFLNKKQVSIVGEDEDSEQFLAERISSGWNSLVHIRGSQAFGFRYRWSDTSQLNLMMIEDWAIGRVDQIGDDLYATNAPDVAFGLQLILGF